MWGRTGSDGVQGRDKYLPIFKCQDECAARGATNAGGLGYIES